MNIQKEIAKAFAIWRANGSGGVFNHISAFLYVRRERFRLAKWVRKYGESNERSRANIKARISEMKSRPLISIILPVYSVDDLWIKKCIDSVIGQIYENWELCIADDCSPHPDIRPLLEEYAAKDSRIKLLFRETNGHISAASNSALDLANGVFSILLDHDDLLTEDAAFWVAKEIEEYPNVSMIYSDEDMIDDKDRRYSPKFKPDWSRDLFYSANLITHLSAYRTDVLKSIGGFRLGAEGSQDYDLALRVIEQISPDQIRHIPRILYHWRAIEGSVALSPDEKPYAHDRARESIQLHLDKLGVKANVEPTVWNLHRVRYLLPEPPPRIEVISVTSESNTANILNASVKDCDAEVICFLADGLKPLDKNWLNELASFAIQSGIGAVGGRILDRKGAVVDGGLIIGTGELVNVAHKGLPTGFHGNMFRNQINGNYSAVSLSCMAMRREVFDKVGGFDEVNFPDALFGVDICLRLRETGYRIVFTPYVEMVTKSTFSQRKPSVVEEQYFRERWGSYIENDPFYNPNLSKKDASFSIDV